MSYLKHLAQIRYPIEGNIRGLGRFGFENTNPGQGPSYFNRIVTTVIGIMTLIAFVWFVFLLISGAISWIASGGDANKIAQARGRIVSGLIGITIVVTALFITQIVARLLGVANILDPASYVIELSP